MNREYSWLMGAVYKIHTAERKGGKSNHSLRPTLNGPHYLQDQEPVRKEERRGHINENKSRFSYA
jgi:hypothetical protein